MTGEFALIDRLAPYLSAGGGAVLVGTGDDAAVVDLGGRTAVLAVDVLVEGRHWRPELSGPADAGWKAVAVNCSDLAAMGAEPVAAVVALQRPPRVPVADVETLYAGMAEAAAHWGLALVGGDTVASDTFSVSVTVLGVPGPRPPVRRAGAQPGDALVCVGGLGAASAGLAEAVAGGEVDPGRADPVLLAAHRRPRALVRAGRLLAESGAHAMIDVSDGLGADVGHLCTASGVSALLRAAALPISEPVRAAAGRLGVEVTALACGGEDFALVAALPPDAAEEAVRTAATAEGVPGAVIGTVVDEREPRVGLDVGERLVDLSRAGYDHFGAPAGGGR